MKVCISDIIAVLLLIGIISTAIYFGVINHKNTSLCNSKGGLYIEDTCIKVIKIPLNKETLP